MMRTKLTAALVVASALLSGCLVPEKFKASVDFNDDLSYSYSYKGTTTFIPVLMEMASKKRSVSAADERAMAAEAQKYQAKNPDVKKMEYAGNARFNTVIEGTKGAGARTELFQTLLIMQDGKGNQGVVAKVVSKDAMAFKDIGLELDGQLVVKMPSKAKIVQTNGNVSKGLLGMGAQTVEWTIQKSANRPILVFTVDKS